MFFQDITLKNSKIRVQNLFKNSIHGFYTEQYTISQIQKKYVSTHVSLNLPSKLSIDFCFTSLVASAYIFIVVFMPHNILYGF